MQKLREASLANFKILLWFSDNYKLIFHFCCELYDITTKDWHLWYDYILAICETAEKASNNHLTVTMQ